MTCPECTARQRLLAEAEATLRDKRFKYSWVLALHNHARLLGSYERDVKVARENVASHRAVCTDGVCRECGGTGQALAHEYGDAVSVYPCACKENT